MSFFDSDIIREELEEISEIQRRLVKISPKMPFMENEELVKYFDAIIDLIEKQKIFYARLQFSEDPEAQKAKRDMTETAIMLGMPVDGSVMELYNSYIEYLRQMREDALQGKIQSEGLTAHPTPDILNTVNQLITR